MNKNVSPIGLFRRDITAPEQLVATTIARQHLVDELLGKLKRRGNKKVARITFLLVQEVSAKHTC
jgi:hypothetical protein